MTTLTTGVLADISEAGARLEASDPPEAGATAVLVWGSHEAVCTIAWSEPMACGLTFLHPLSGEVVAETAALNCVVDLPIASVDNIVQGKRRTLPFQRTEADENVTSEEVAGRSLSHVFARFRRT